MDRLAKKLPVEGFDWYVAITRGGLVPACLLAQITGQAKIDVVCTRSYGDGQERGELQIFDRDYSHLRGARVLLLDDLCDSGRTMDDCKAYLEQFECEVHTAAVFVKSCSTFKPDYFIEVRPADKWVVFPWEASQNI